MKQALMQRYLSFMAEEIEMLLDTQGFVNYRIVTLKKKDHFKHVLPGLYNQRESLSKKIVKASSIQKQVKASTKQSFYLNRSTMQAMEKQVTKLLAQIATVKRLIKMEREEYALKADYWKDFNSAKNKEARLVELQQAIRKSKSAYTW